MEGSFKSSPQLQDCIENHDSEDFTELSTILVAIIQEVKDRIYRIESIFCSQLFPNFLSKSKNWEKILAETKKAAEIDWKNQKRSLLSRIEELLLDKVHAQEQIQHLTASLEQDKAKITATEQLKLETEERNALVFELQEQLRHKTEEVAKGKELQEELLKQIKLKSNEKMAEHKKGKDTTQYAELRRRYKTLSNQYSYLLSKLYPTPENTAQRRMMEEESDSPQHFQGGRSSPGKSAIDPSMERIQAVMTKTMKEEIMHRPGPILAEMDFENSDDETQEIIVNHAVGKQHPSPHIKPSSISSSFHEPKCPMNPKVDSLAGLKRPVSSWRGTRSNLEHGAADPHDDFLDTPMENVKRNTKKFLNGKVPNMSDLGPKQEDGLESADDETVNVNADPALQKQYISAPWAEKRGFKYVGPVRKKAERENLKGVECKQCKKFYDAVLPDDKGNNENNTSDTKNHNGNCNNRCEHHDGVSRHRYKYVPPMTPEGFWNIGFESEM